MGYAVIMFVILLLMAVSIALSANYGISKDSQKAPLLAENAYAEREGGKMQTDMVVIATKVNGTMYYSDTDTDGNETINLYLTVKNNGSINLDPLKYSIILNSTWVGINSATNNTTYPLENTYISSLNLTQKPLNLTLAAENGVKIIIPSAPKITGIDIQPNNSHGTTKCYYDLILQWLPSVSNMWNIKQYAIYYTFLDIVNKNNNVTVVLTPGPDTSFLKAEAIRRTNVGQCGSEPGENNGYVWMTAIDTHGNEGVPSNTCYVTGGSVIGEGCYKIN